MSKENVETTEKKELSKTEQYKVHLQKIVYQELGIKVSRDKAWSLFKSIIHGTVEHVLHIEDKKMPLAGVGTFQVLETKPRGSKAGFDKDGNPIEGAESWPCVPRFRFYPSSVIDNLVEHSYGLGDHDVKEEHYGLYKSEEDVEAEKKVKEDKKEVKENVSEGAVEKESAEENTEDAFDGLDDL